MSEENGLPKGWAEARIDAFATTATGGTPSRKNPRYFGGAIPWVKSGELGDGRVYHSEETLTDAGVEESNAKLFPAGTLCIALYGATVGKLGILEVQATTNQAVCGIFLPLEVLRSYLFHFLLSIRSRLLEQGKGGAQSNISNGLVRETIVPLAPLPEQHRIVEKIEELFSDLDAGVASLERAKRNLKRYRASVLKSAVEGRLTEEWRKEHPQAEDGQMLLDRILRERREKWEKDQLQKFKEKGKEPPKNWESKYEEPSAPDASDLPELPEEWAWIRLKDLVENMCLGKMLDKVKNQGTLKPYLGNINVRWFAFDLTELKEMRFEDDEVERFSLRPGDLVVCEGGEPGRCAVWDGEAEQMMIQKAVHRLRFAPSTYSPYFAMYFLYYGTISRRFAEFYTGTTINHLTGTAIAEIAFPLPPLAEQEQIVALVEERLSQIDSAEKTIDAELIRAKRLRQSILKRAFEGNLVPQDPKDEPASVLLERIKATREAEQPKKKSKKAKKVKAK